MGAGLFVAVAIHSSRLALFRPPDLLNTIRLGTFPFFWMLGGFVGIFVGIGVNSLSKERASVAVTFSVIACSIAICGQAAGVVTVLMDDKAYINQVKSWQQRFAESKKAWGPQ